MTNAEFANIADAERVLKIRLADRFDDLEPVQLLTTKLHAETRFADIPFSFRRHRALFMRAIDEPERYGLILSMFGEEPVGLLYCAVGEYIVGHEDLITTVYAFYVRDRFRRSAVGGKAALRMLNGLIKWSELRGSREIMIHVTSGIDIGRTDKLLRRLNFSIIGANYSLPLANAKHGVSNSGDNSNDGGEGYDGNDSYEGTEPEDF